MAKSQRDSYAGRIEMDVEGKERRDEMGGWGDAFRLKAVIGDM